MTRLLAYSSAEHGDGIHEKSLRPYKSAGTSGAGL